MILIQPDGQKARELNRFTSQNLSVVYRSGPGIYYDHNVGREIRVGRAGFMREAMEASGTFYYYGDDERLKTIQAFD